MKCSWEAAFSVVVTPRHFAANAPGARVGWVVTLPFPARQLVVDSGPSVRLGSAPDGLGRVHVSASEATVAMVASVQRPPWDRNKARENRATHGIGFDEAQEAVLDRLSRSRRDPEHSYDEPRSIVIGESIRGRLLFVVISTDAEGKMRIISARRATKRERHAYEDF
jgi:uncharacterized DUF497 family protein